MMRRMIKILPLVVATACGGEAEIDPQTADNDGHMETTGSEYASGDSSDYANSDVTSDYDSDTSHSSATTNAAGTDKSMSKGSTAIYGTLADWDGDGDKELTIAEFKTGLTKHNVYGKWDSDGNGELIDREYQTALFNAWDTNGDEIVDSYEFRDNASHWVASDVTYGTFADWDLDGNQEIIAAEFNKGVKKYHFFESYDADGNGEITDLEYQTALFNAWDLDGDQRIDAAEYRW